MVKEVAKNAPTICTPLEGLFRLLQQSDHVLFARYGKPLYYDKVKRLTEETKQISFLNVLVKFAEQC